jgi:hypothetical protein
VVLQQSYGFSNAEAAPRPRFAIGRVLPTVLLTWIAVDLILRFLPLEWLHVNPTTIAVRRPSATGPFEPRLSLVVSYPGDAAREANLLPTEQRPPVRFTTNALGYRRNPFVREGAAPDVVTLRGQSMMFGAALSDDETLPAALTRESGFAVYNGSVSHLDDDEEFSHVDRLLRRLPALPPVAVVTYLEHENPRRRSDVSGGRVARLVRMLPMLERPAAVYLRARRWADRQLLLLTRWIDFSPLEVVADRVDRRIANDGVLPNVARRAGRQLRLPDGRRIVFRRYETAPAHEARGAVEAERTVDFLEWWRDELARRGIGTVVLILPSRYTVYGPLLEEPGARAALRRAVAYTDRVATEVRRRGITTVDAAAFFRARAPDELRTGILSFYREDNHWNPDGVRLVAGLLAEAIASRGDAALLHRGESPGLIAR